MKDRSDYPVRIADSSTAAEEERIYWLSRTPEERIAAVELLREQHYALKGYKKTPRIQKVITVRNR